MSAVCQDGNVYVLDTDTGQVVGKKAVSGTASTDPLLARYSIYFGTSKGVLYNVETFDPALDKAVQFGWTYQADGPIAGTPVVAGSGDNVFVATTRGTVCSVQPGSADLGEPGTLLWSYRTGGAVRGGLAVYQGVAYAGCDDGYLYAIDITSRALRWKFQAGAAIKSTVTAKAGLVYFGTDGSQVYALHAA